MPVQVVEKSGEGLSRIYGVTVPQGELASRLSARIEEIRPTMNLKGFRPGKVPAAHVKKMYGAQLMGEVVQAAFDEGQGEALQQAGKRPAAQPEVKLTGDLDKVMKGEADLAFDLDVELMPEFEPTDVAAIELTRPVYEATDAEVEESLKELAASNRTYEAKKGKTAKSVVKADEGDMVVADFVGRIEGETFEGGSAEGAEIVIGSGRFIPGFE
ncbi:MAG: FKBP-type peptidyl-prolyl cis-trans isomerase, partial [Caulobacteraceae bacterium]|nr:FKBP-type peptidyl-prolyl cis-trans isomerase [Caulobacter sp.]